MTTKIQRESQWCDLTNSSHRMTEARLKAWRIRKSQSDEYDGIGPWVEIEYLTVKVTLVPGWSGRDHLFDLTLVDLERQFASVLYDRVRWSDRNGRPNKEIISKHRMKRHEAGEVPKWVIAAADALSDKYRASEARKERKNHQAMLASCTVEEAEGGIHDEYSGYLTYAGNPPAGFVLTKYPEETFGGVVGHVYFAQPFRAPAGFRIVVGKGWGGVRYRDGKIGPTRILFADRTQAEQALAQARADATGR